MPDDRDAVVRLRAFDFLTAQRRRVGEASIPRAVLERGFDFEGVRVPLIGPQGIFKPAILPEVPLTITTAPPVEHRERPYDDGFIDGGFLRYRYRGTDPTHRDNVGLRTAMQRQTPLIYLHGIVQGVYEPPWPVFVVEDHPETLTFIVAIDGLRVYGLPFPDDGQADRKLRLRQRGRRACAWMIVVGLGHPISCVAGSATVAIRYPPPPGCEV
jgi:putative restriction endonuclease